MHTDNRNLRIFVFCLSVFIRGQMFFWGEGGF
jgi:hypothetical protein